MINQNENNFQGSYNIIAKNICVGCQMEQQVQNTPIYHNSTLEVLITFSSTKKTKKILQTNLFNKNKSQQHPLLIEDQAYLIEYLEQYQVELIDEFLQQQQPLEEIVLIINSTG